jgi:3-oxoacyl-[acyl-carrier protein] reductase
MTERKGLLEGKRAVVTAAAGAGIGYATALRFVEEGAQVVLSDHHDGRLQRAAGTLAEATGYKAPTVLCDVTQKSQLDELVAATVRELGGLDVMVNNAGFGAPPTPVDELTDEDWDRIMDLNLTSAFRGTRAAVRHMKANGGGSIINLSSIQAWVGYEGQAHYGAAKAGVMALTRSAAVDAAQYGIRVNAIAPHLSLHPFLEKHVEPELMERLLFTNAMHRGGKPVEMANVILFLASDLSSYMTGEVISVSSQRG